MLKMRGFTLVELLVVLVLLGVLSSLVLFGSNLANSPQRSLEQEAQRLQMLLQVLLDEAVLDGHEYGLLLSERAYQVVQFEHGRWQRLDNIYHLPPPLHLSVAVESRAQPLPAELNLDSGAALVPQLLVLSSGEYSPFNLQIEALHEQFLELASDGFSDPQVQASAEWMP